MDPDASDLGRFLAAQDGVYEDALAELRAGRKRTHWMWFIFPQLRGLGRSETARFFGIGNRSEAESYLAHPVLGARLRECTSAVLSHVGKASAHEIFGSPDDLKFRSCLALFGVIDPGVDLWTRALDGFYAGSPDPATLQLLGGPAAGG